MKLLFFTIAVFFCLTLGGPLNLTPENFDSVVDGSKNVFIKFYAPWCGHCKSMIPAYEETAEAFSKESSVVIADVDADAHKELATRFGVSGFPTLKFFKKGSTTPTDYSGGREANDIIDFINTETGSRGRIAKAASAVSVLTPLNFDSIVLDSNKDVFVEFYAPWCGHCKRLAPIWEKLASIYKYETGVAIASVDADAHKDLGSRYDVSGFPTLIYFSKDNKKGEKYNGGRELADFIEHINKEAGTHRTESGRYHENYGRHSALDELVKKFIASPSEWESIAAQAEKEAGDKLHASWYAKFMKVIIKKGIDWVKAEKTRVENLLEGGSMSGEKLDEFTVRKNVLSAFHEE